MKIDYLKLALSNLKHRRLRAWLTMIGIFIGIAAVVSLIGLGQGLRTAISGQFGSLGTDIISIQASGLNFAGPPGSATPDPLTNDLTQEIQKVKGVEAAFNRYIETVKTEFKENTGFNIITTIPQGDNLKIFERMTNLKAEKGRLLKRSDSKKVFLGANFGEKDNAFNNEIKVGDRIIIKEIKFEVVGIMEKKGSFIMDNTIFMLENEFLDYIRDDPDDDSVNIIAAKAIDEDQIPQIREDIEKLLRKERDVKKGEENFEVSTPQQSLESLNSILGGINLFVTIIASISLIVGGIGIMNTMYTAVLERTKEIGIMKSIGAKNSTIFTLFFFESGLLGMVGGLIGVILGLILAYGGAALGRIALNVEIIQANISLSLILSALLFSFFMGTIFGTFPAIQASKLQPVESLRSVN